MAALLCSLPLAWCSSVLAQEDPTRETSSFLRGTSPGNPIAGQPFVLNVFSGECKFLSDLRTGARIQSIVENTVTVYVDGVPDLGCSFTTGERQYDLPAIPVAGQYIFRVFFVPSGPGLESLSIGARNLTVVAQSQSAGNPAVVPTAHPIGLLALVVAALASAFHRRRRR